MQFQPASLWRCAMALLAGSVSLFVVSAAETAGPVGKRPYEMDWANRIQDEHPPLVDFEDLAGWRVECRNAEARFERTREQQIWGSHVGKLTYRGTGADPEVRVLPPQPIPIRAGLRCRHALVLRQQLGLGARSDHAAGRRDRPLRGRRRPGVQRLSLPRGLDGVVPAAPAALPGADRAGQAGRKVQGAAHHRRPQQAGPRALLRQPRRLHRGVPSAAVRAAGGARHRSVPGPVSGSQHRPGPAAVPDPAETILPAESDAGFPHVAGTGGRGLRVHL